MASPIGTVPAVFDIGYDNAPTPNVGLQYPYMPAPLGSATVYTGATGTASSETGVSSTFSNKTTQSFYVNPFQVDRDIVYREVRMAVSGNTVAATGSGTAAWCAALYKVSTTYSQGNSGNLGVTGSDYVSGTLYTLAHGPWQFNILATQNSVTAQTYRFWSGSNSSMSSAFNSTGGNISTDMTIQAAVSMHSDTAPATIPQGHYLLVHGFSSRSSGAAIYSANHGFYLSQSNTLNNTRFLGGVAAARPFPLLGNISNTTETYGTVAAAAVATHLNLMPATFASSAISNTGVEAVRWLVPDIFY